MGTCASSQYTNQGESFGWETTVNIIHLNGRLQQLKEPMKAGHALSQNPNCFICSSDSMCVDSLMPHVAPSEDLQLGQIYFLIPLSKSRVPLTLQDLGALAIKANAALAHSVATYSNVETTPTSQKKAFRHPRFPSISFGYSH